MELAAADSVLARAEQIDTASVEATIARSRIAELHAILAQLVSREGAAYARTAFDHADAAVRADPGNIDALESRARARDMLVLELATPDSIDRLRRLAVADLERVVKADSTRARALALLGRMQFLLREYRPSLANTWQARELDAFLDDAHSVAYRLGIIHFELGQETEANEECDTGAARAPGRNPLAYCRLLLAALAPAPDLGEAGVQQRITALESSILGGDRQGQMTRFAPLVALAWRNVGASDREKAAWQRAANGPRDIGRDPYEAIYLAHIGAWDDAFLRLTRYAVELGQVAVEGRMFDILRTDTVRWTRMLEAVRVAR
jgi:tetratricopeptide (TPR) repeat protein